jgi:hypothetical protein
MDWRRILSDIQKMQYFFLLLDKDHWLMRWLAAILMVTSSGSQETIWSVHFCFFLCTFLGTFYFGTAMSRPWGSDLMG